MPWLVRKQGDQFCVFREGAGGEPEGASRGCHPTHEQAMAQQRALYANVEKSLPGFTLWKEAHTDLYRWFSFYSNNFRDNDRPAEIISKESHERFVQMVDKGIVDFPELWLWHVPVAWGKADWLAFENGIALASGTVYPQYNFVAENLAKEKGLATSHGMPKPLIVYDEKDKSVIRFHITKEISPLPLHRAANKRTGFVILKGDDDMPLDAEKRDWLVNVAKLKPDFVKSLEDQIDAVAAEAKASGIESKEAPAAEAVAEPTTPPAATPTPAPSPVVPAVVPTETAVPVVAATADDKAKEANWVTREEVASVLTELLTPILESQAALSQQLGAVTKELKEVKRTDAEKITALKEATPPLSLRDMISKNLGGGFGAKIKEGDALNDDKPAETAPPAAYTPTIVPFLNGLVNTAAKK